MKRIRLGVLGWALCAVLGCAVPLCAAAQTPQAGLVVLDLGAAGQAGFVAALRIQLGSAYTLRELAPELPAALPERIAAATELAGREHAVAAVWVEEASLSQGMRSAVLYVVGQRQGRALLEAVQVPSARGPDLPRVLALKLGELLSELAVAEVQPLAPPRAVQPAPLAAASTTAPVVPQPAAASEGALEPAQAAGRFWAAGRAGVRFDFPLAVSGSRAGLGAELTPEWTLDRLRLGLGLGAAYFPSLTRETSAGSVELREVAPRALATLAWQSWLCDVGVHAAGTLSLITARGRTPAGRIGDSRHDVLGWALGVFAERRLWGPLGVVLFVEAAPQLTHLELLVNGEPVLDRGRVRVMWGLDLRLRTALTAAASGERALSTRSP